MSSECTYQLPDYYGSQESETSGIMKKFNAIKSDFTKIIYYGEEIVISQDRRTFILFTEGEWRCMDYTLGCRITGDPDKKTAIGKLRWQLTKNLSKMNIALQDIEDLYLSKGVKVPVNK